MLNSLKLQIRILLSKSHLMARKSNMIEFVKDKVGKLFIRSNSIICEDKISLDDKITSIEDKTEWKEAGWVAGYATTVNVDVTDWKECLVVCCVNGLDVDNRRALVATVVPKAIFAIGYAEKENGRHQAYYGSYRVGLDFISNTQIKLYAASNSLCRVYYR